MLSRTLRTYHFVCLPCRRSVKAVPGFEFGYDENCFEVWRPQATIKCSHCGGKMPWVGKYFTPPRRNDDKQWKKLEWMISQGWPGPNWQTTPAMSLRDVRETAPVRLEPDQKRLLLARKRRAAQKKLQQGVRHKVRKERQGKNKAAKEWQRQIEYQNRVLRSHQND